MQSRKFKITNDEGIHAKPATSLVNICMKYQSDITLSAYKKTVDFKSIMGVMALGVYSGTIIEVATNGSDEVDAINAISNRILELELGTEV